MNAVSLLTLLAMIHSPISFGQMGADILLNNVSPVNSENSSLTDDENIKSSKNLISMRIDDPFLVQLFSEWKSNKDLPYEVNQWFLKIFQHKFTEAAHLLSAIEKKIPMELELSFLAVKSYLFFKMELSQTFLDSWLTLQEFISKSDRTIITSLEQVIGKGSANWMLSKPFNLSPTQIQQIKNLKGVLGSFNTSLRALTFLRAGLSAKKTLSSLPLGNPLRVQMAKSIVLSLAKIGDLAGAAKIIKTEIEPHIKFTRDLDLLADNYLLLARLLYQAGALDAAETFYRKIPNSDPRFLQSRAELAWVLLRKGKIAQLRGELKSLSLDVYRENFTPEIFLVRSISNLKLCRYDLVENDFNDFIKVNKMWAKRIDQAISSDNPPRGEVRDFFISRLIHVIGGQKREMEALDQLAEKSIRAALPAVGVQAHWENAKRSISINLEVSKKDLLAEKRRFWLNRRAVLAESIKKMKFVKVEALSQMRRQEKSAAAISNTKGDVKQIVKLQNSGIEKSGKLIYPFEGIIWPDELFNLRAQAQNNCLQGMNK